MPDEMEQWLAELLKLTDEEEKMTEKQIRILQAAVDIFSEKGYAATSTNEIAQKAGVAEGTIFRHYKTKKDLLLSIVAPMMTKLVGPFLIRDFAKVLDMPYSRFEDFLRAVTKNRIAFAKKHSKVLRILIHEIPFQPELQETFKEYVSKQVVERFMRVVEYFQKQGQIVDIPTYAVIRFTASVVIGFVLSHVFLLPELQWDEDKELETTIDLIMHGLASRKTET